MKFNFLPVFLVAFFSTVLYSNNSLMAQEEEEAPATKAPKKEVKEFDPIRFIDMGVASSARAFKSRKVTRYNMWEYIENDCDLPSGEVPVELINAFDGISRKNQSSIFDLIKGNVLISNQIISPTERQFMHSPFLTPGSSSKIFGCLSGLNYREENFILNNVDYFEILTENLYYIKDELEYSYHKNGRSYHCDIIRTTNDLDKILEDPTHIGWIFSIGGGHALGNYLYIEQGQHSTPEYLNIVKKNIGKLKGLIPIRTDPQEYLDIPIFSINFGSFFDDGMSGKASRLSMAEEEAFRTPLNVGGDITPLGVATITELLSQKNGQRRILVDIGGMSLRARQWYYDFIKDQRYRKDTIPILCMGVGVSGLSFKDGSYGNSDKNSLLSHQEGNMAKQDMRSVLASDGLLGLSLERDKLAGKAFMARYENTLAGSANRRRVVVDAIVGNLCKVIHSCQNIKAWDMITISSRFDTHARHFEEFSSSADMVSLHRELVDFFENPRDIEGLYTAKEIKKFMYNYSAKDIVDKIMFQNALNFLKLHLPKPEAN